MSAIGTIAVQLKNSVIVGLRLPRFRQGLLFGIVALLIFLPLLYLDITPIPLEQNWSDGTATLYLAASNTRLLFPNQCVDTTWNVEGIKTVSINRQGKVGQGTEKICDSTQSLTMQVELQNGSTKELRIGFERLFFNPIIVLLWVTGLVALVWALHNMVGSWVAIAVLSALLTIPTLLYYTISEGERLYATDYVVHLYIIEGIRDGLRAVPPHFLYHVLAIGWTKLFPNAALKDATLAILLIANILTCVAMYVIVRLVSGKRPDSNWKWTLIYLSIPLILFVGPINFITPFIMASANVYPNPFHSPTYIFLKPFAVGLFACFIALLNAGSKRVLLVAGMAILIVLGALAKPAYTLPIVPVAGLLFLISFVRPLPIKRWELMIGILLPAILVLGWQYLFTYGPQQSDLYGEQASIKFAPLVLFLVGWNVPIFNLVTDFIISLIFPIFVYIFYRSARHDLSLNVAWLVFLAGQALAYLFVEMPKWEHGNMVWSGRITSLVLFVMSIAFFLRKNREMLDKNKGFPHDGRFYLGMLLLALHIIPTFKLLL